MTKYLCFSSSSFSIRGREQKKGEEVKLMREISEEDHSTVCQRLSKESCHTGLSILHWLSTLCSADVLKDTLFDVMHNIPLNVVGNLFKELIANGKLDSKVANDRLQQFPWTAGIVLMYIEVSGKFIGTALHILSMLYSLCHKCTGLACHLEKN